MCDGCTVKWLMCRFHHISVGWVRPLILVILRQSYRAQLIAVLKEKNASGAETEIVKVSSVSLIIWNFCQVPVTLNQHKWSRHIWRHCWFHCLVWLRCGMSSMWPLTSGQLVGQQILCHRHPDIKVNIPKFEFLVPFSGQITDFHVGLYL